MINGDRPSGYFGTGQGNGMHAEGETRQCVHCQFTWQYKPGSRRRYGLCTSCQGITCARPECIADQRRRKEQIFMIERKTYACVPFEHWNYILMERAGRAETVSGGRFGKDLAMNEAGLIIPK